MLKTTRPKGIMGQQVSPVAWADFLLTTYPLITWNFEMGENLNK